MGRKTGTDTEHKGRKHHIQRAF